MILRTLLATALSLLQASVKNPKSLTKERSLLVQVRDVLSQIISGIDAQ